MAAPHSRNPRRVMVAPQAGLANDQAQPPNQGGSDYDGDYDGDDDDGESVDSDATQRRSQMRRKRLIRFVALVCAVLTSICAGSLSAFSLFAPKLQSRLHYTQLQINGVAIGSALALYLPISPMGYVCDRMGPSPLALLSSILFGGGYGLAAFIYRMLDTEIQHRILYGGRPPQNRTYPLMVLAFVFVGAGTCAMYIASVSTCAKNYGKGRYRGLALAMPITAFGLSGMCVSQFGSRFLAETLPDGSRGDVDVFRLFVVLATVSAIFGVVGFFFLRVVDEQELIDEAIEELETSGFLDGSMLIGRANSLTSPSPASPGVSSESDALLASTKDTDAQWKKNWVLNAETHRFLTDRTMWPFAISFLLLIGPGEAFVNNLGTIIGTLTPPSEGLGGKTSAATHVSIFAIASTVARLSMGSLTDLLAPSPETQHLQLTMSNRSFRSHVLSDPPSRFAISRVVFMLVFGIALSVGLVFLASGAAQNHAERFWVVSGLVGAGYGATFSLAPLLVTIIWGVENFATNFGIIAMLPALGSTFWGLVYSAVYQAGAHRIAPRPAGDDEPAEELFCYGSQCYAAAYWAQGVSVWVACLLLFWAWKGRDGWQKRGIVI